MERPPYTKYERLRMVKESVDWCKIKGNSFSKFLNLNNLLDKLTRKTQIKTFLEVKGLKTLSTTLQITEEKKEVIKENIIVKTQFCTIEIPGNCSSVSFSNILKSIKEVQKCISILMIILFILDQAILI